MRRARIPAVVLMLAALAAVFALTSGHPQSAQAHGTLNLFGQSAEHEKLTRAATACAPGFKTADVPGRCFEPLSEDQLAGTSSNIKNLRPIRLPAGLLKPTAQAIDLPAIDPLVAGTIGAVGAADIESFFSDTPHCTAGDYLDVPSYPQTRTEADAALMRCHRALQRHFRFGIDYANSLVDANGRIIPAAVKLPCDPVNIGLALNGLNSFTKTFDRYLDAHGGHSIIIREKVSDLHVLTAAIRAFISAEQLFYSNDKQQSVKCQVIGELGRMMHGMQDFYSHGNWADESDPKRPIGIDNPPGLDETGRAPLMNMLLDDPPIDPRLATACFAFLPGECDGRIDHDEGLGKDEGHISFTFHYPLPNIVRTSNPVNPRGKVDDNFYKAARGAVAESTGAWTDFGDQLIARYGKLRGTQMICAITHDDPVHDCTEAGAPGHHDHDPDHDDPGDDHNRNKHNDDNGDDDNDDHDAAGDLLRQPVSAVR